MAPRCLCPCHQEARGNYNEAAQRQDYPAILIYSRVETVNVNVPVETDDALEAAVACDACRNMHCNALLTRYIPDPDQWVDPPRPAEAAGQGDGDDGA